MKKRRSRHNPVPPPWYIPKPVVLTEEYQREVDLSTARLERRYRQAQKRADQAQARLEKVKANAGSKNRERQIKELEALVELRRAELDEIRRLMNHATYGSNKVMHRAGREERLEMGTGRSARTWT